MRKHRVFICFLLSLFISASLCFGAMAEASLSVHAGPLPLPGGLDLGTLEDLLGSSNSSGDSGSSHSSGSSDSSGGSLLMDLLSGLAGTNGSGSGSSQSSSSGNSSSDTSSALGTGVDLVLGLLGVTNRPMKECTVSPIADQTYTGKAITPRPVVKYKGDQLKRGTDYTVSYSNNTKAGTARVTLKGKGNYTGTKTVFFKIVRKNAASDKDKKSKNKPTSSSDKDKKSKSKTTSSSDQTKSKRFTVKVTPDSYIYNGSARKPAVKVSAGGKSVGKANYTVSYKNNKSVGKATAAVKGKGDYKGYAGEATFKITLKKTSLTGCTAAGDGKVVCRWNADPQADGYRLSYATNKTFKNEKTVRVDGGSKKTAELTKLTVGKQYYVRIRSCKKVGGSYWYSEWSAPKKVKVK